jgi:hypothetical protein
VRRRLFIVVAGLALALCGAAVAALPAQLQFDAKDQAWAKNMLLGRFELESTWEDMPGNGEGGDPRDNAFCPPELSPDESDLTITGGNYAGYTRTDGGALAFSSSTVWLTAEHAQADWDRTVQPQLLNCVAASLASASTKKVKVVITKKTTLSFPAIAPRTAAYRVAIAYKSTKKVRGKKRTISMPATFELVLLGNGRATLQLGFLAFNKVPIGDASKTRALVSLARRLQYDPKH